MTHDLDMSADTPLPVAIVGAGPYGLSIAASLRAANVPCRVFGRPMWTWRTAMPAPMHLKSDGFASNLSVPTAGSSLADYCREHAISYDDQHVPIELSTFIAYGLEFQARYVPHLDQREVVAIARQARGYRIELDDGAHVTARCVILAVGVTHFAHTPDVLSDLPAGRLSHSSAHRELSEFAGVDVTVVGAGSSAVELAALLADSGARPRLLARRAQIQFNDPPTHRTRPFWQRVRHPKSGLGPGLKSWFCCTFPRVYRMLPVSLRTRVLRQHLGPKSQHHFRERIVGRVPMLLQHKVEGCALTDKGVEIRCRDEGGNPVMIETDHVIAATGYAARVDRLRFLAPDLRAAIKTHDGYPVLSSNFESSEPGLYFVGLAAAGTFGPLMRFVYGAGYTARRLVAHLA